MQWDIRLLRIVALSGAVFFGGLCDAAASCDELVGRLISNAVRPAIASLGCSDFGKVGLDEAQHSVESVCYSSSGPQSEVKITIQLSCKTSTAAVIQSSVSERVTATATVRASDCEVLQVHVDAAGEIGKILIVGFDIKGKAREALKSALRRACR
jgi:hypothetical protein